MRQINGNIISIGDSDHLSAIYFESFAPENVLLVNKWHRKYWMVGKLSKNRFEQ